MALAARRLPPLPTLKDILRIYNIKAQKKLSQNFIMDPRLLDKIARTAMANRENVFTYGRVPLTLTFQHEVAHRMIAPPNDKERSRLSVLCQNWAHVQYNLTIPPGAFVPKPDVNVGLVTLTPLTKPYISLPFKLVEKVVTTLFHGKQKYLYNTAKNLFPPRMARKLSGQMLLLADVDPYEKAINLNMKQLDCLCHAYRFVCDENKGVERFNFRQAKETLLEFSQKTELEESVLEELGGSGLLLK